MCPVPSEAGKAKGMFEPGGVAFGDGFFGEEFRGVGCGSVLELKGLGHECVELDPFGA